MSSVSEHEVLVIVMRADIPPQHVSKCTVKVFSEAVSLPAVRMRDRHHAVSEELGGNIGQ